MLAVELLNWSAPESVYNGIFRDGWHQKEHTSCHPNIDIFDVRYLEDIAHRALIHRSVITTYVSFSRGKWSSGHSQATVCEINFEGRLNIKITSNRYICNGFPYTGKDAFLHYDMALVSCSPPYYLNLRCLIRSYLRQRGPCSTTHLAGHCQQRCDAKRYSCRGTFWRKPERYPGYKDYEGTWDIDLSEVISELTFKFKQRHEATECPCGEKKWMV